jgi:hypothetical protein
MTRDEFFWRRVEKRADGCWQWRGNLQANGYGRFGIKSEYAHRVSYVMHRGAIPVGLDIDHLCRNRACVNPDHLEPVTRRINLLRGKTIPARNAAKTHCAHGHEYSEANTRITPDGSRICKECHRITEQTRRRRANV